MPKRMILGLNRKCLFCADETAFHVKTLRVKEKTLQTLVCILCEKHVQSTNRQVLEMAAKFPDRVHKTPITGLSKNQIEIREIEIQVWG
ncbi:MAG: hypothetical protein WBC61_00540 [Dehalococcoidia bacterium]